MGLAIRVLPTTRKPIHGGGVLQVNQDYDIEDASMHLQCPRSLTLPVRHDFGHVEVLRLNDRW